MSDISQHLEWTIFWEHWQSWTITHRKAAISIMTNSWPLQISLLLRPSADHSWPFDWPPTLVCQAPQRSRPWFPSSWWSVVRCGAPCLGSRYPSVPPGSLPTVSSVSLLLRLACFFLVLTCHKLIWIHPSLLDEFFTPWPLKILWVSFPRCATSEPLGAASCSP